jgi:hypothetical protein
MHYTGIDPDSFGLSGLRSFDLGRQSLGPAYEPNAYGRDDVELDVPGDGVGVLAFANPGDATPTVRRGPPALPFCPSERVDSSPGGVDGVAVDSEGKASVLWHRGAGDPPDLVMSEDQGELDQSSCTDRAAPAGDSTSTSEPSETAPGGSGTGIFPTPGNTPAGTSSGFVSLVVRAKRPSSVAVGPSGHFRVPGVSIACPRSATSTCRAGIEVVRLYVRRTGQAGRRLGRVRLALSPGQRRALRIRLSRWGRHLLRARGRLSVQIRIDLTDGLTSKQKLRLTLRRHDRPRTRSK